MATNNATNTSNPITVAQGGTGDSSLTAYSVLTGGTTSTGAIQSVSGVGTSGQALVSNGASALPTWQNVTATGAVSYLASATASSSAAISFTGLSNSYYMYQIVLSQLIPATNGANLQLQVSTNNGSSYISSASAYAYDFLLTTNGSVTALGSSATALIINSGQSSSAANGMSGIIQLYNVGSSAYFTVTTSGSYTSTGAVYALTGGGFTNAATNVNAIQLLYSTGNITSGSMYLYGFPT